MSKKIIIPNSLKQIKQLTNLVDGFLLGIKDLSVNTPSYFTIEEIKQIIIENPNKDIFINLNKNMHMFDLMLLEDTNFLKSSTIDQS